jgi:DNA recombination protein RmuC
MLQNLAVAALVIGGANLLLLAVILIRKPKSPALPVGSVTSTELADNFRLTRSELSENLDRQSAGLNAKFEAQSQAQSDAARLDRQEAANSRREQLEALAALTLKIEDQLNSLRRSNEEKLEAMRNTVSEKLTETLEARIGSTFSKVQERLDKVHEGLGQMQNLATDVGNLGRVLTNVRNRGTWGEVHLARQLEDVLTPNQFEANVAIKEGSGERVEFAIKLPGNFDGEIVYLPVDSKFPQEDYERILEAIDSGDKERMESAGKDLERAIKAQAKLISDKYIYPPKTTNFGVMYLPTEGLFAEVVRRPGLVSLLQSEYGITIMGPTTLMALLNSLNMGFRTLAIGKQTSEAWAVLGAAKSEFRKLNQVWEKLESQLEATQKTVSKVHTRTRAVERKLRKVEELDPMEANHILELSEYESSEDEED